MNPPSGLHHDPPAGEGSPGGQALFGTPAATACLMGMGTSLLLSGLAARAGAVFATDNAGRLVIAAGLFCLSVGSLIPQRAARYLGRRRAGGPVEPGSIEDDPGAPGLLWAVLASVALLSGLAVAAVSPAFGIVAGLYDWILGRFLWSPGPLAILQWSVVAVVVLPGLALLGLGMSCACRLASPACRWRVLPLGWGLVGAGSGAGLAELVLILGVSVRALTTAAAVPVLLVAVLSARRMDAPAGAAAGSSETYSPVIPGVRDSWPLLIRVSVAWIAASTAAVVVVWAQVSLRWPGSTGLGMWAVLTCLPAMVGAGIVLCERSTSREYYSAGGLGAVCAACGVGLAASCSLPAMWLTGGSESAVPAGVPLLAGGVSALLAGYALAYGHRTVLCRVGSRAAGGAALLCVSLAAAAAIVLVIGPSPAEAKTSYTTLAAIALSLVALGGTTIIHEPAYSPRARRWRLAAVFASIGVMMYVLPLAGRRWSRSLGPEGVAGVSANITPPQMVSTRG